MLESIKQKLADEKTQRAILNGVGIVGTFVATQVFAHYMNKGVDLGINKLMAKLHPVVEQTPVAE